MPTLFLATLAHLRGNPFEDLRQAKISRNGERPQALEILERGALLVDEGGRILACGRAETVAKPEGCRVVDFGKAWLLPGLIDAHLHFPQFYKIAASSPGLLAWLKEHIYPAEQAFGDPELAGQTAETFVQKLIQGGVTTAMVFGSQFYEATEALFETAARLGLRLIAGITLMDREGPRELLLNPKTAWEQSERLLDLTRRHPRLHYALTPRFALSCSPELLEMCGAFLKAHPEVYLQTHINETQEEIAAVLRRFPSSRHYLDVYDRFGLIGERTVLAHNLYPTDGELKRLAETGAAVCHCPSSNLFLGSGLFSLKRHLEHRIPVAVGTDIGAGLHLSVWEELSEVYKVQQLQGLTLTAGQLLYLVTLGPAKALKLDRVAGNFEKGKIADFWVLDPSRDDYLTERLKRCDSLEEQLLILIHLGKRHHIQATFISGKPCDGVSDSRP